MEAFPRGLYQGQNTFESISMISKRLVLFIKMMKTALYLKYATKTWYMLSRILLTFVEQWSCNNDMRISTKEMVICFRRDRTFVDSLPYIYMNGNYTERVSQAKVLGVTISSDLCWNAHVDEIISKARKRVYMIYQLNRLVSTKTISL